MKQKLSLETVPIHDLYEVYSTEYVERVTMLNNELEALATQFVKVAQAVEYANIIAERLRRLGK